MYFINTLKFHEILTNKMIFILLRGHLNENFNKLHEYSQLPTFTPIVYLNEVQLNEVTNVLLSDLGQKYSSTYIHIQNKLIFPTNRCLLIANSK